MTEGGKKTKQNTLITINRTEKKREREREKKVKKSPRIYDHVSMGTLAENLVSNPKPWEI